MNHSSLDRPKMQRPVPAAVWACALVLVLSGCATKIPVFSPQEPAVIFDQARTLIEKYYIDTSGNGVTLDVSKRPDVGSLLAQLDSSAELLSWKKAVRLNNPFRAGIGLLVKSEDGEMRITGVLPGSPARHAGLKSGDRILRIDDEPVAGRSWMNVIPELVGAPGSAVNITVESAGGEPRELKMIRMVMDASPPVGERIIEKDMGYLRIGTFAQTTAAEVKHAVKDLIREGTRGLVIDLRDCSGLSDERMAGTAQLFLKEGLGIGRLSGRTPELNRTFVSQGGTHYAAIPLAVIVNENTSLGAEMFAAALHENGRALLVGQKTAGRRYGRSFFQLKDGSYLVIRTYQLKTASGSPIQDHGILPDLVVDLSPEDKDNVYRTIYSHRMWEDGDVPVDKQLAAAISALRDRAMGATQGAQ